MNKKKCEELIHGMTKNIVQKLVESERAEWPPSTSYGFYQTKRPEREKLNEAVGGFEK